MKNLTILTAFVAVFIFLAGAPAQADNFYQNSGFSVDPDLGSGFAFGVAQSGNAVATGVSSGVNYFMEGEDLFLSASFTVSGVWGDPSIDDPYYDFLEQNGLSTYNSFQISDFSWNGEYYELDQLVNLTQQGQASLVFGPYQTTMTGWFTSSTNGVGAVPIQSSSHVQIFEPGHIVDFDWQVNLTSKWLVTTEFQTVPVPTPAGLAVLGMAGLVSSICRRR